MEDPTNSESMPLEDEAAPGDSAPPAEPIELPPEPMPHSPPSSPNPHASNLNQEDNDENLPQEDNDDDLPIQGSRDMDSPDPLQRSDSTEHCSVHCQLSNPELDEQTHECTCIDNFELEQRWRRLEMDQRRIALDERNLDFLEEALKRLIDERKRQLRLMALLEPSTCRGEAAD